MQQQTRYTISEMAAKLNRPPIYLRGLQLAFNLPLFKGRKYTEAYLSFLKTICALRTLSIPEKTLTRLWRIERKLMLAMRADNTDSPTWFLDACGTTRHRQRRLLLSNFDTGTTLPSNALQPGLNFSQREYELFTAQEMGEDTLAVLKTYLTLYGEIQKAALDEKSRLFDALSILRRFPV